MPINHPTTRVDAFIARDAYAGKERSKVPDTLNVAYGIQHRPSSWMGGIDESGNRLYFNGCCVGLDPCVMLLGGWFLGSLQPTLVSVADALAAASARRSIIASGDQLSGRYTASTVSVTNTHWWLGLYQCGIKL
jgi:hypothetical protein